MRRGGYNNLLNETVVGILRHFPIRVELKTIPEIAPIWDVHDHVLFALRLFSRPTSRLRSLATQHRCYSLYNQWLNNVIHRKSAARHDFAQFVTKAAQFVTDDSL